MKVNIHLSQQDRQGRLSTTLGTDALVLLRMDGSEELSGDFEWRVEALSSAAGLDLESLLGTHATVEIDHAQGTRAFDGIVCEAEQRGGFENGWRYDLVLRPWLHVADLRRNMRIFHNKTVIQIVEDVLSAYSGLGNPHLDVQVTEDYPVLEYTVQYGESDADFVRRQLERSGITWGWRHETGSHTLLLTDAVFCLPAVPGGSRPYHSVDGYHRSDEEHFRLWSSALRITTGAVRLTEYNFKMPNAAQEVDKLGAACHTRGDVESYDWPGDYLDQSEGRGVVNRRLDAEQGQAPRHHAQGDVVSLGAGWRVTLAGDPVAGATGRTFVCLKAQHRFRAQAYGSGASGNDETPYDGAYILIPDDTPFRPERRTHGPRVQGPETAVVVGEGEIDCDEHGRILVRFHWDLDGANSMRVRVSQNWASKGWGGMVIPRIGMEVIVEHLRGDPDKPIVTGCVYNGENTPPYALPEHKTRSTFRTDTHQGAGFNELRFEDQEGREEIFIHAERDMTMKVENHSTARVDHNKVTSIGGMELIETGGSTNRNVGANYTVSVGTGPNGVTVRGCLADDWEGIRTSAYYIEDMSSLSGGGGNYTLTATGAINMAADKSLTTSVGTAASLSVGGTRTVTVGKNAFHSVSQNATEIIGRKKVIDAHEEIILRSGLSQMRLQADGTVTISGTSLIVEEGNCIKMTAPRIDLN